MSAFDPNRFWPNGDGDSREWRYMGGADRSDGREARPEAYKRSTREYAQPHGSLVLVSQEDASDTPLYESGEGYGLAPSGNAVRRTDYVAASKGDPTGRRTRLSADRSPRCGRDRRHPAL